jgi:hypothetical protein
MKGKMIILPEGAAKVSRIDIYYDDFSGKQSILSLKDEFDSDNTITLSLPEQKSAQVLFEDVDLEKSASKEEVVFEQIAPEKNVSKNASNTITPNIVDEALVSTLSFLSIHQRGEDKIIITTEDALANKFLLNKKMVFDFERPNSHFKTISREVASGCFSAITIGANQNFYRISMKKRFAFDYSVANEENSIIVECKE